MKVALQQPLGRCSCQARTAAPRYIFMGSCSWSRQHGCLVPVVLQSKLCLQANARTAAAAAQEQPGGGNTSSSSLSIVPVRRLQQLQDMLDDAAPWQPGDDDVMFGGGDATAAASTPPGQRSGSSSSSSTGRKSQRAAVGFGRGAGPSSGSSRAAKAAGAAGAAAAGARQPGPKPAEPCPCQSGLQFKACCLPFLSGVTQPRSALELAQARITATTLGDVSYLVATTHPDSTLCLGGSRDLNGRSRRLVTRFRENKFKVVGMAHCEGDSEGTWVVLSILQATAGEMAGEKVPVMFLLAKRSKGSSNSSGQQQHQQHQRAGVSANDWLYMGQTTQLPQHEGVEPLYRLLQLHVPECLSGGDGEGEDGSGARGSSISSRQLCFVWDEPHLALPTAPEAAGSNCGSNDGSSGGSNDANGSGSSGRVWYVDLLQPAAERMAGGAGTSGISSGGRSRQQSAAGGVSEGGQRLPPGVVSMDELLAVYSKH